jgi:hypothetical protein
MALKSADGRQHHTLSRSSRVTAGPAPGTGKCWHVGDTRGEGAWGGGGGGSPTGCREGALYWTTVAIWTRGCTALMCAAALTNY